MEKENVPKDIEKTPEDAENVPKDIEKTLEDAENVPKDIEKTLEDIENVPKDAEKTPKHHIKKAELYHEGFELAVILKALGGLAEVLGSIFMLFLKPEVVMRFVTKLTQKPLQKDPSNWLANQIIIISSRFSESTQLFGIIYLASHGIVKLILVGLLWKRKIWAYPLTILSLIAFIIYQIYCFIVKPSVGMIALTLFDIVMIWLTYQEYCRIRSQCVVEG